MLPDKAEEEKIVDESGQDWLKRTAYREAVCKGVI